MRNSKTILQIVKNVFSSWGSIIIQSAISLFMVPFLLGHIGKKGYGIIALFGAVVGFANIADLGLRAALSRELSEKVARSDEDEFRFLSSTALCLYLGIASVLITAGWFLAPWFTKVFNVGDEYRSLTIMLLRTYASFTVLLSFITPVFTAGLASFMRYDIQNHVNIFSRILVSIFLIIVLSFTEIHPLIVWCLIVGGGGLLTLMITIYFYRRVCYSGILGLQYVDFRKMRSLFELGGGMYILQLTNVLAQRADPFIISRFIGLGGVALYQIGSRLPQMINPIVLSLVNQLTPLTTKYHVTGNLNRQQEVLILGTRYTLLLGAFFTAGLILFSRPFCYLWLGSQLGSDTEVVIKILRLWACANLFSYAGGVHWPVLLAARKIKFAIWLNVIFSTLNFICSLVLVGYYKFGVSGVMIGTVASEFLRRLFSIWYLAKITNLPLTKYVVDSYVSVIMFFISLVVIGYLTLYSVAIEGWFSLIIACAVFGVVSVLLAMPFERKMIAKLLANGIALLKHYRMEKNKNENT